MRCPKEQDVVGTPDHADLREWASTRTGVGGHGDLIYHLVTDDGLNSSWQDSSPARRERAAWRHRMIVLVDRFDDVPVAIDVQSLCRTFKGQSDCFGRTVVVGHPAAEGFGNMLACRAGEGFTCGTDQHGMDAELSVLLRFRKLLEALGYPPSITGWKSLRLVTNSSRGVSAENRRCIPARQGMARTCRVIMVFPRKCPPVTKTAASLPLPRSNAHTSRHENTTRNERRYPSTL